jgi:hypothetical protein
LAKNKQPRTARQEQPPPERALPPFDRIYFDTEPLVAAGWPDLSVPLQNVANLAKGLNISLHVPEVAYLELEARCLRNYEAMFKTAVAKTSELRSRLKVLGGDPSQIRVVPDVQVEMRNRYLATAEVLKQTFLASPTPALQTHDLLKMAIKYELAFEEDDKGFRDTMIFLSVVEEVRGSPKPIAAVLVSKDSVFRNKKEPLESWAKSKGASVVFCAALEEIERALEHRQTEQIQAQIEADRRALEVALSQHSADIQDWLDQNVEAFKWQEIFPTYPGTVPPFTVTNAKFLRLISVTPQYNPKRTEGERVRLSFDIEARLFAFSVVEFDPAMRILAEPRAFHSLAAILQAGQFPAFRYRPITQSFERVLEIEAEATVMNGKYTDFKFLTARIKHPSLPPVPLLK